MTQQPNNLIERYQHLLSTNKINHNPQQEAVIKQLYQLQQEIEIHVLSQNSNFFNKIFNLNNKPTTKGMYIYGDVGRGKSMLMDLFYETSSLQKKRRVHFHAFMLEIHRTMHLWRNEQHANDDSDPITPLAKKIATSTTLLCFDELQVTDIADAMILGRLFEKLFKHGVLIVATSNRPPDDLYKDGLQRERFLPFIQMLKENVNTVHLQTDTDYRLTHLKSLSTVYYTPNNHKAQQFLQDTFSNLTNNATPECTTLQIGGRKLTLNKTYGDVAWSNFSELCEQPLGTSDYIELAKEFSTILISDIPQLTMEDRNEAKRFVSLIDELYEHKVKLICTAAATPNELYEKGDGSFEFSRTASRLIEMQSLKYMQEAHIS